MQILNWMTQTINLKWVSIFDLTFRMAVITFTIQMSIAESHASLVFVSTCRAFICVAYLPSKAFVCVCQFQLPINILALFFESSNIPTQNNYQFKISITRNLPISITSYFRKIKIRMLWKYLFWCHSVFFFQFLFACWN